MCFLCAADEQQFLYNITYSDGRNFSSSANSWKSCLVHPPCIGRLLHLTNGLVMLPYFAECVEATGSITTISTPEILEANFTIPSCPTNLPTNEQQTLTLHGVRAARQGVPMLDVTTQLIKENVGKMQTEYKTGGGRELRFKHSWRNTLSELASLFAFTLWMLELIFAAVWLARKFYKDNRKQKSMNNPQTDQIRGTGSGTEERFNLVEKMRTENTQLE